DNGGPFTRGRYAPVRIGSAAFPFVVYDNAGAVWRVAADGSASRWTDAIAKSDNALIGSSVDGSRFIIRRDATHATLLGFDGTSIDVTLPTSSRLHGWITPDGRTYF